MQTAKAINYSFIWRCRANNDKECKSSWFLNTICAFMMDSNMPSWIHWAHFPPFPNWEGEIFFFLSSFFFFFFHFRRQASTSVSSCLYTYYVGFVIRFQSQSQNTRQKCQTLTPSSFWEATDKESSPRLGWNEHCTKLPSNAYQNPTTAQDTGKLINQTTLQRRRELTERKWSLQRGLSL